MEKNSVSSNPESVCERIFKAVSVNPVQTIRRNSYRPLDAMPASAGPNATLDPPKKGLHAPSKTAALGQKQSIVGFQRPETPEEKKAAEVVLIDFERSISMQIDDTGFPPRSDMKEKSAMPQVPVQNHRHAAKAAVNIEPVMPQSAAVKENKTKPKVQMIKSTKRIVGQRHDEASIAAGVEVAPPHVLVVDKPKHKVTPKVGHGSVQVLVQDQEKASPKVDKFSDYIDRAKLKIRATSDVGTGKNITRVDSMNERVTKFIDRAKFKIRTSSGIGGGKSVSFK